ncbi:MAG TPA: hypothetical protein VG317_07975 [Pseudonocardiaceae bacterium]|nr:hypothetical protein [Pseudonocardiaceae bacterium]
MTTIDCDDCPIRGAGCADCVVTVLFGGPPETNVEPPRRLRLVPPSQDGTSVDDRPAIMGFGL